MVHAHDPGPYAPAARIASGSAANLPDGKVRFASMTRLAPGDTAPDFTLPDPDGTPVSLSSFAGRKVVVYFYPEASTAGCTTQACDFRDNIASLQSAGYQVLGISPDGLDKQRKFRDEEHVPYPLLCDPSREVLEAYGAWGEKNCTARRSSASSAPRS